MFKITHSRIIGAPRESVWRVITDTASYAHWNDFVTSCDSTFEVGSPIVMRVKLIPSFSIKQKETILQNVPEHLLEYGIKIPFGILSSSRKHILSAFTNQNSKYESVFILKGLLAPLVGLLLGKQLEKGFTSMTDGIVERSETLHRSGV